MKYTPRKKYSGLMKELEKLKMELGRRMWRIEEETLKRLRPFRGSGLSLTIQLKIVPHINFTSSGSGSLQ